MVKASHRRAYEVRSGTHHEPVRNRILAAVPEEEHQRLSPHLEFVTLGFKQALYEPNAPIQFGYFPNSGMICVIAVMRAVVVVRRTRAQEANAVQGNRAPGEIG
jgi:hypothetical protein